MNKFHPFGFVIPMALCLTGLPLLSACGENGAPAILAQPGEEYLGRWSRQEEGAFGKVLTINIDISRDGSIFLVKRHGGPFGIGDGTYPATFKDGVLHFSETLRGVLAYSQSTDTLIVEGDTYQRQQSAEAEAPGAGNTAPTDDGVY